MLVADGRAHEAAAMDAREMVGPHEPRDPLARDVMAGLREVGADPGTPYVPRLRAWAAVDLRCQGSVGDGAGGGTP